MCPKYSGQLKSLCSCLTGSMECSRWLVLAQGSQAVNLTDLWLRATVVTQESLIAANCTINLFYPSVFDYLQENDHQKKVFTI